MKPNILDAIGDWRTTTPAVIAAAAGFVLFSPELFSPWPWALPAAKYVAAGGLLALGVNAKSHGAEK